MEDLIKKIKSKFLGTETFNVGFNNKSPVKGISRKASPLNEYSSQASFSGPGGAISTYGSLMKSNYGAPVIPDNAEMGDVYAKAIGQVGKMSGQLGAAFMEADARGWAPNIRKSSKKSVSRKSSSPLNQDDDDNETSDALKSDVSAKIAGADFGVEGEDPTKVALNKEPNEDDLNVDEDLTDQDKLIAFCTKNPTHRMCTGKNTSVPYSEKNAVDRVNDSEWW